MGRTQGWRVKGAGFIAATILGSLALSGVALADDISNSLDTSVDAVAKVMPLTVGGANGATSLYVTPGNGDGKNGCNLTGSTTLSLSVTSSDTSVATVSPSSVTFSSCGDIRTLSVTPQGVGEATISASQTSNNTGGTFNLAPAAFTVVVAAATPANTAPSISVAGVVAGASYALGAVPAATCEVSDAEDGDSTFEASLSDITGPYAVDGIGSRTASCTYTDAGGVEASASLTYGIVDPSAPAIGYTLSPSAPDGDNGWYRSDVALDWTVTEDESPSSLVESGCTDVTISADQHETPYTCSATSAGGSAGPIEVKLKRDATAPTVMASAPIGTSGTNDWYTSDVTVAFTASDATSGPENASASVTSVGEGAAVQLLSPAFTDQAGNTVVAGNVTESFKIDKTAPTDISFVGGPADGASYYYGEVPASPTCTATDAVSGVASCDVSGYLTANGTHTLTATATDNAGNVATAPRTYTVLSWTLSGFYKPVDMGVDMINTVKAGSTVPLKFEAFKGATELTDLSAIRSFTVVRWVGAAVGTEDAIETYSTGGTSLRYDWTGGQYIQNWQVPKAPAGTMYRVTLTLQDGTATSALFKLK